MQVIQSCKLSCRTVRVKGFIVAEEGLDFFLCLFVVVVKKRSKLKQIVPKHFFLPQTWPTEWGKHSSRSLERQRIFHAPDNNDTHFTNPRTWAVMWDSKIQIRDRDQVKGHDSSQATKRCRLLFTAMIFSVIVLATVACCEAAEKHSLLPIIFYKPL